MPLPVVFSPEARLHLEDLEEYIAMVSYPERARSYILRLAEACQSIGLAPYQGRRRDYIRPNTRTTGFERRATILFEVGEDKVTILGVFYGGRRFDINESS